MLQTRTSSRENDSTPLRPLKQTTSSCAQSTEHFGGHHIPNEVLLLIIESLPIEDRANLAATNSQFRCLALPTLQKLKAMRDLPCRDLTIWTMSFVLIMSGISPAPASLLAPGWLTHRIGNPHQNMLRLQRVIVRCSSVLTYLNLLGTNILNQDLMAWIYNIDLPQLENLKFP